MVIVQHGGFIDGGGDVAMRAYPEFSHCCGLAMP